MSDSQIEPEKKRSRPRSRVPISCYLCRKRKTKCDKKKPHCSSCITYGNIDLCSYEKHPWKTPGSELESFKEIESLKEQIKSLEQVVESQRQQLAGYSNSSTTSTDNTLFESDDSNDLTIELSKAFDGLTVKDSILQYFGPTSYMSIFMNDSYLHRMLANYRQSEIRGFREQWEMPFEATACSSRVAQDNSAVVSELPPLHIIMFLLDRFFEVCYPFAPYINKHSFIEEVKLSLEQKNNRTILTSLGKTLHSTMALVLIMMRFSYLTLPCRQYYDNIVNGQLAENMAQLIDWKEEIRASYISRATILITSAGSFSAVSLRAIQAALLLRTYKQFCPEGNEGGSESGIFIACLVQMARYHGIHGTYAEQNLVENEAIHLWNKIWAQILYLDASQSFNAGHQLLIYQEERIPFLNEAIPLSIVERPLVLRNFALKAEVSVILRKFMRSTSNKKITKRSVLLELANDIMSLMNNRIRMFDQLYKSNENDISTDLCDRMLEFCLRIDLTYKFYIIQFMLYFSADDLLESHLKENYLRNGLEHALIIFRIGCEFCKNPSPFFGEQLEKIVAQSILIVLYRTIGTICSISLRISEGTFSLVKGAKQFRSPDAAGLLSWLNIDFEDEANTLANLFNIIKELHENAAALSSTYYLSYRVSTGIKIFLDYYDKQSGNISLEEATELFSQPRADIEQMWNNEVLMNFDYVFNLDTSIGT